LKRASRQASVTASSLYVSGPGLWIPGAPRRPVLPGEESRIFAHIWPKPCASTRRARTDDHPSLSGDVIRPIAQRGLGLSRLAQTTRPPSAENVEAGEGHQRRAATRFWQWVARAVCCALRHWPGPLHAQFSMGAVPAFTRTRLISVPGGLLQHLRLSSSVQAWRRDSAPSHWRVRLAPNPSMA
jgi:hypothetical protein